MPQSIVFLGTSAFAVPSLKALVSDPAFQVLLVITQPDKPTGRNQTLTPPPMKVAALKLGLAILQPEKMNVEFVETQNFAALPKPDFLVVVSYGQILSADVLAWPLKAAVNVHASLLPLLRGASPLQHAILQNLSKSGVTMQRMVQQLDAGPILSQASVLLGARETFTTLHDRLAVLGAELLIKTLKASLKEVEQDASQATFCRKIAKTDGIVNPKMMTAATIDRMVRALTPWPGVSLHGNKILETAIENSPEALTIPCAQETMLFVLRIQPASGKPMSGADFMRGNKRL